MKMRPSIVPATRLEKCNVVNPKGEDLGQVQTFMLDMLHGRIAFVVVSFRGLLGMTDKWFALPWDIVGWSPKNRRFVVKMPQEVLVNAPGIDKKKWPDDIDLSWLEQCYAYYGCARYWEETPEEQAKKLAYNIWEQEGRLDGKQLEHYYKAEKMLTEQAER